MVMGKFIVSVIGGQLKQYVVFTGHINLCPDGFETHLDGSGTFVRGSGRSWKWSRSVRNVPKRSRYVRKVLEASRRSWKVLEGHGRFWKVPDSTTHSPAPLALGGKPPRQPWPAMKGEAHQGGGILLQVGLPIPVLAGFWWEGVGSFGRLVSPSWTPKPPWAAP